MSPLSEGLKCGQCGCTESLFWKSIGDKQQLCNDCFELSKHKQDSDINRKTDDRRSKLRKSTRSTRYNGKNGNNGNSSQSGAANSTSTKGGNGKSSGRGRRNLFRRAPVKAPSIPATTQHVTSLFYKGSYIQIGDIVSLCNVNQDTFYAQIRGLIIDNFCERSAVITWLLPTQSSPPPNEQFDPSTYVIGPEEDQPRLLSCMQFVMHAPSDYYHNKYTPYPPVEPDIYKSLEDPPGGFIWTSMQSLQNLNHKP